MGKMSNIAQERMQKKIRHLVKNEGKDPDQAYAIAKNKEEKREEGKDK